MKKEKNKGQTLLGWCPPETSDEVAALLHSTWQSRMSQLEASALTLFCAGRCIPVVSSTFVRECMGTAPWSLSTGEFSTKVTSGEYQLLLPSAKALQYMLLDLEHDELVSLGQARGVCLELPCFLARVTPSKRPREEDA